MLLVIVEFITTLLYLIVTYSILSLFYTLTVDWQEQTIKVYDDLAEEMAAYFRGIGSRTDDIEKALELAGKPTQAKIVEL